MLFRSVSQSRYDPAARVFIDNDGIKMYSLTYQFEQCYDEFIGSCLRQLLGKGNSIQDILATEDGQRLLETACEGYPDYLRGEAGKLIIAKMNKYFRDKVKEVQAQILSTQTKTEARSIGDPFPKTAEEMLEILNG